MSRTRRDFLKDAGAVAAAGAAVSLARPALAQEAAAKPAGANERIVLGIIGLGGQATNILNVLSVDQDVRIGWLCDVDQKRLSAAAAMVEGAFIGGVGKMGADLRRVLDDKDVDAVIVATPDHWHAPATILACDAGKHVYVEKPASHNIREGRMMIDAARRNKRIVQVGTQSRSTGFIIRAMELLRDGVIGEVLISKAWNSQHRGNIGNQPPVAPPKELDYDTWVGPAPFSPYQANKLHYNWRWWHDFGTGDIGNDGVHDIDIARWGLGVEAHPNRVAYVGGQLALRNTDQQWPDTYYVAFDYELGSGNKKQLIYEQRTWSPYLQEGAGTGNAFYGTKGQMILSKEWGWKIIGAGNVPGEKMDAPGVELRKHVLNFFDCIKSGKAPAADIEVGHLSSSLSHLGNIASRTGRGFAFDPSTERVLDDDGADKFVGREYRDHWATPRGV